MPNTTPLPAGAVSGDVWEHGEQVTARDRWSSPA
jgi:hypothetical protein